MIEPPKPQGLLNWLKESVTIKLMFITFLILLLLIPSSMIGDLITERANRQTEMEQDVSDKWSGSQLVQGPVLVIPYQRQSKEKDSNNNEVTKEVTENFYVLPDALHMKADVTSEILHRGMFETVVYSTRIHVSGDFKPALTKSGITPEQLLPGKAKLTFSISDLKGLKTNPVITSGSQTLQAEPVFNERGLFSKGLQADINLAACRSSLYHLILPLI